MHLTLTFATSAAFVIAVASSLLIIPLVRWLSRRVGIVDRPDPERKLHGNETALCGGLGVFAATCLAFFTIFLWFGGQAVPSLGELSGRWLVLLGAAAAMMLVGLFDDVLTLRGRQKLIAQFVILSCVVGSGTLVEQVSLFGWQFDLGMFAYPITMLWLLGAVNALNLIDGADGMATTAGTIICAGLTILSLYSGGAAEAIVAVSLAGALVGFLAYNRPPASIFLGDAGSMLIGLVVGVLATWSSVKGSTVLAAAPVAVLAIPLFDSLIAILRRSLTGRSIYATDRAHLHHLLSARFGPQGMLLVVALLCGATTIAAVLAVVFEQQWIAVLGVLIVLGTLVITRSFGHAELSLLLRRLANFAEGMVTPAHKCEQKTQSRHVQMQGNRQWRQVWESCVEFAQKYQLSRVKMDLNISWIHEGYHGVWSNVRLPEKADQMSLRIPLVVFDPKLERDRVIGRLDVIARGDQAAVYDTLEILAGFLAELRPLLTELLLSSHDLDDPKKESAKNEQPNTPSDAGSVPTQPAKVNGYVGTAGNRNPRALPSN